MKQVIWKSFNGVIVDTWKPLTIFEFMAQPVEDLDAKDKALRVELEESLFCGEQERRYNK